MKAFRPLAMLAACISISAGIVTANLSNETVLIEGHTTSLNALVTFKNGTTHKLTLEGVGCTTSMCSRVKIRDREDSVWLDGLTSVSNISRGPGAVTATFALKNGTERQAEVIVTNRVLYVRRAEQLEKLDLGSLERLQFLN